MWAPTLERDVVVEFFFWEDLGQVTAISAFSDRLADPARPPLLSHFAQDLFRGVIPFADPQVKE